MGGKKNYTIVFTVLAVPASASDLYLIICVLITSFFEDCREAWLSFCLFVCFVILRTL